MNIMAKPELKSIERAIQDVIYRACLLLDAERFSEWLDLCTSDFKYRITTYSPEIRRRMTWYEQDLPGLKGMIEMLPKHNTDHGRLTRHATNYTVDLDAASNEARATTSFSATTARLITPSTECCSRRGCSPRLTRRLAGMMSSPPGKASIS